jgi:hypothetical protein
MTFSTNLKNLIGAGSVIYAQFSVKYAVLVSGSENAAQGGHDGKKSRVLDWTMDDDDSCEPNRYSNILLPPVLQYMMILRTSKLFHFFF